MGTYDMAAFRFGYELAREDVASVDPDSVENVPDAIRSALEGGPGKDFGEESRKEIEEGYSKARRRVLAALESDRPLEERIAAVFAVFKGGPAG